jgi:tetratricopeptide (TPR) repeat protein
MRTRMVLLGLFGLLGLAIVAVIGFYVLRNTSSDDDEAIYFARGMQLSKQAADRLEQDLKSDPGRFADRIELLAFYGFKTYKNGLTPEELANRRKHILWVIERQPASTFAGSLEAAFESDGRDPEGLEQGKKLWLLRVQAKPGDARILYNASQFFFWGNDAKQSEALLEQACAVDPRNHDIASSLAERYWSDARHSPTSEQATSMAAKSLKVFEQALSVTHDPLERLNNLPDAAQAAYEAGEYERAAAYSKEVLRLAEQPEYADNNSDAIHYGNIVLGRIAVRQGDLTAASAYLVKAAKIKSSFRYRTIGPNMMLAKELLDKGERKSVLEYFGLCGKFWEDNKEILAQWRSAVASGSYPDFGANLRY